MKEEETALSEQEITATCWLFVETVQGFNPEPLKGERMAICTRVQAKSITTIPAGISSKLSNLSSPLLWLTAAHTWITQPRISAHRVWFALCRTRYRRRTVLTRLLHSSRDRVGWSYAHDVGRDSNHSKGPEHPQDWQPQLCCFWAFCQENSSCSITDLAGVTCWKRSINTFFAWTRFPVGREPTGTPQTEQQSWPAVVLPSSLKAGFSFAKPSRVVEGLIPSSWCTVTVFWLPWLSRTVVFTGTISVLNSPICWAFAALSEKSMKG